MVQGLKNQGRHLLRPVFASFFFCWFIYPTSFKHPIRYSLNNKQAAS